MLSGQSTEVLSEHISELLSGQNTEVLSEHISEVLTGTEQRLGVGTKPQTAALVQSRDLE